jgi:hypothetical protein
MCPERTQCTACRWCSLHEPFHSIGARPGELGH